MMLLIGGAVVLYLVMKPKTATAVGEAPNHVQGSGDAPGFSPPSKPDNSQAQPPLIPIGSLILPAQPPKSAGAIFGLLP